MQRIALLNWQFIGKKSSWWKNFCVMLAFIFTIQIVLDTLRYADPFLDQEGDIYVNGQ